jgi:NADH-quinone oxidoreductase subunit L
VSLHVVGAIGACTALFAATVGLVQNDIKKVLAYSTISQLGYMFLALGVGAFSAGIFHLMTHAFFKALLFLGAGSVIHAMHDEQNIQKMGGLKSVMPVTYWTFLAGAVAIAGIFPLSGFFSKDEILWQAFAGGHGFLWLMGLIGAALTAFYMFRLVTLTFEGEARWGHGAHPHEAPRTMTIPLIVLAALSVVGGVAGIPVSLGGANAIEHWLEPVFQPALDRMAHAGEAEHAEEYVLMALSVGVALSGLFLARHWYLKRADVPEALSRRLPWVYKLLSGKYFVDEIYDAVVVTPVVKGSEKLLWRIVDVGLIDWSVNAVARATGAVGRTLRLVQTGVTQSYALIFLVGIVAILGWILAH